MYPLHLKGPHLPWLHAAVLLALREEVLRRVPKWQPLCLGIKCEAVLRLLGALREEVLRRVPKWQPLCLGIKCEAVLRLLRRTIF